MAIDIAQCDANNKYNGKRPQSPMLDKLLSLKPGETMVYYRGDFDREAIDKEGDSGGLQNYKRILRELRAVAIMLRDSGRISIDAEMIRGEAKQGPFWIREYKAQGL